VGDNNHDVNDESRANGYDLGVLRGWFRFKPDCA
jgi:hypothetical protein